VVASDYCLIGEEIYAASAYLSQNPVELAVVRGQDLAKVAVIALMCVGSVLLAFGSEAILQLITK
jgi:hypothetical protein